MLLVISCFLDLLLNYYCVNRVQNYVNFWVIIKCIRVVIPYFLNSVLLNYYQIDVIKNSVNYWVDI